MVPLCFICQKNSHCVRITWLKGYSIVSTYEDARAWLSWGGNLRTPCIYGFGDLMKRGLAWSFTHPRAQMIKFRVRFSTSSTINNRLSRNTRCRRGMCRKIRVATRASPRVIRWVCDLYGVFSSLPLFAALVLPGQHIVLGDKKTRNQKMNSLQDASSAVVSLNGTQIVMNNMARSRAPLPGFSSFV